MFAIGRGSDYLGRCDLFKESKFPLHHTWNMDFYVNSNECPAPLRTRELIRKNWHCGDNNGALTSTGTVTGVTLAQCDVICQ